MPLGSYLPILVKSISTPVYQTFLFVSDSIELCRACSSNVYSVLRTKSEVIFMTVYAIREPVIVILVHAPNSATWPLL